MNSEVTQINTSSLRWRLESIWYAIWRKVPRLVWVGQEIDVQVTFKENRLNSEADPMAQLMSGALPEISEKLGELGINFDQGMGMEGRDWEWDWSLSGPISVKFRGHCREPQRRQ